MVKSGVCLLVLRISVGVRMRRFLLRREGVDIKVVSQLAHHACAVMQVRSHRHCCVDNEHLSLEGCVELAEVDGSDDGEQWREQVVVHLTASVAHTAHDETTLKDKKNIDTKNTSQE